MNLKERIREIREASAKAIEEIFSSFKEKFEENGGKVHLVKPSELDAFLPEGVPKSKSTVVSLFSKKEFQETDCGDWLRKVTGLGKLHPVEPLAGVDLKEIAERLGLPADPQVITAYVREKVRPLLETEVAVTGANGFSADGYLMTVENEGNITRLSLAKKHVVVTGLEKGVWSCEELVTMGLAQAEFSVGHRPARISLIGGPTATADVGSRVRGMYGSEEVEVLVVDYGARGELAKCISCGRCLNGCPAFVVLGRLITTAKAAAIGDPLLCTGCGYCASVCPLGIDYSAFYRKPGLEEIQRRFEEYGNPYGSDPDAFYCC